MAELSAEELTELERAILDACAEKRREGWGFQPEVTLRPEDRTCCPMGAITDCRIGDQVAKKLGFPLHDIDNFMRGFDDGRARMGEPSLFFDMGRRFRERLERGEL